MLNFVLKSHRGWTANNAKKISFKVLEKQNLQNQRRYDLDSNLAILRTFGNLKNYFLKDFTPSEQLPKLLLLNLLAKCLTFCKYLFRNLTFLGQNYLEISL